MTEFTAAVATVAVASVALLAIIKMHEALGLLFAAIADRRQLDHDAPRVHDLKPREEW